MLASFCDDRTTDKNTDHSYLDVYDALFAPKRQTATHILEIGIGPYPLNGGSIKMWASYFSNAQIHALDVIPIDRVNPELIDQPRIFLHTSNDAYNRAFFTNAFSSKGARFDVLIDDGPHTLESMVQFVTMYSQIMKDDGILIVEDVQHIEWADALKARTPVDLLPYVKVYDRRNVKGRVDDILFVIDKSSRAA